MKKTAIIDTANTQIRQIDKKYARLFDELRKSEQEKAVILDAMTELVLFLDTDLRVIWANKAIRDAFNLKGCRFVWLARCWYWTWSGYPLDINGAAF